MKTQMRFQKILAIIALVIAAFAAVYALMFCSGPINQINQLVNNESLRADAEYDLYDYSQNFSSVFLILGIVLILTVVLLFITGCHSRRKYYVTNYIATGIVVVYGLVYAVMLIINISMIYGIFNSIDLAHAEAVYNEASLTSQFGEWDGSTWVFSLGYVVFVLVLIYVLAVVFNLVWKFALMKGEKKLLNGAPTKEVA